MLVDTFCYYLIYNVLPLCEYVSRYHLHSCQISARSDFKYGCHVAGGHLGKKIVMLLLTSMVGLSQNFNHGYMTEYRKFPI
jgi:hypothetical protein